MFSVIFIIGLCYAGYASHYTDVILKHFASRKIGHSRSSFLRLDNKRPLKLQYTYG